MKKLYDIFTAFAKASLPVVGAFSEKLNKGVKGRERAWDILDQKVKSSLPKVWVHAASLGEFEQVVPVLQHINRERYQVVLTFFSPSGYENKKDTPLADVVTYLPLDAVDNVNKFIATVEPSLAIMVKYEFWPNYLQALGRTDCHTVLVSGIFRQNMAFHRWYGRWMTKSLEAFDHFFLQNHSSLEELNSLGFSNASVAGDTRFDRASQLIERNNNLPFLEEFIKQKKCVVIGSSWPEDIEIFTNWLSQNEKTGQYKVVIAPHEVGPKKIDALQQQLGYEPIYWSAVTTGINIDHSSSSTLVIDSIGLLTKAYSYADVAYVGGGMGTKGLHNILEAATFGVPVLIGKNYEKFPEAGKLEDLGGLFSVVDAADLEQSLKRLLEDDQLREKTGMICGHWINSNTGATQLIVDHLKTWDEKLILD
ncbi:3-deoxy-D-manno-octulosonic acid transferase [Nonlabens xiamenensis]|uniref:3-deoxy-D-manno-octulosonic acid transferase n=1 Tax=Nonlabens xiamenensis TaxID=2341043 RepID=UPI000F60A137|nr:glycosyltransferase N-terminal domain-containing protein [Nonlabens xiamenensis]